MILRARLVVAMSRAPIQDGVVRVDANRITWVGRRRDLPAGPAGEETVDLGEAILLPGLINAHCHLDYTGLAGKIAPPKGFTQWIQAMVAAKTACGDQEYLEAWTRGAAMLLGHGTTCVADIEAAPQLLPHVWTQTPLRVISFRELIHLRDRQPANEVVERVVNECLGMPGSAGRVGLSPHAPYSTTPELLEHAARAARRRRWRLTTHVAESEQEFEMFMYRQGQMFDWLKNQRDPSDCGRGSPVRHLDRFGYLDENLLAVHVNYLERHDAGILGRNRVSVVHCPRSHAYFQHLKFPRAELENAGVNICLGTDSLATVWEKTDAPLELDMFAEMRLFAARASDVPPAHILRMATIHGAQALGKKGQIGEFHPGALADAIVLPFTGKTADVFAAVVHHSGPVMASMIGGQWAIPFRA